MTQRLCVLFVTVVLIVFSACGITSPEEEPFMQEPEVYTIDMIPVNKAQDDGTLAAVMNDEGLWGYVAKDGKMAIPFQFEEAGDFSEGLAWVRDSSGIYGYIDKTGSYKKCLHVGYTSASNFSEGAAFVTEKDSDYFYINKNGDLLFKERIIPCGETFWEPYINTFSYTGGFKNGYALICEQNPETGVYEYYIVSAEGTIVLQLDARWCENSFHTVAASAPDVNGFCVVGEEKDGKIIYGVITLRGTLVLPCEYEEILPFEANLFTTKKNGLWGFVDSQNNAVLDFEYEDARPFSGSVAPVKFENYWGLINISGEKICDFLYEDVSSIGFSENLLAVKQNGNWGVIDQNGEIILLPALSEIGDFHCGSSVFRDETGKFGYVNANGEIILEALYTDARDFCVAG